MNKLLNIENLMSKAALEALLNTVGGLSPSEASRMGISAPLYLKLKDLTLIERDAVVQQHYKIIAVTMINNRLSEIIDSNQVRDEDRRVLEFIRCGASAPMMYQLFGLQSIDFVTLRKGLGLPAERGRPKFTHEQRIDVLSAWKKYLHVDLYDRYLKLHNLLNLKLKVIHMIIMSQDAMIQSIA